MHLSDVKALLKQWYEGNILWRDYPTFLVNTKEGRKAYCREAEKLPIVNATFGWDSKYGHVESHNGKHFIFLNSIIIDNYASGDVSSTIIHEILHVLHPNDSEKDVEEMTRALCENFNIQPENILEFISDL